MKTWGWPDEPSQTETKASDSMAQDCVRKQGVGVPRGFRVGAVRKRRGARGAFGSMIRAKRRGPGGVTEGHYSLGSRTPNFIAFAETPRLGRLSTSLNVKGIC